MVIECHLDYPNWLLAPYWSESFRLFDADESGNIELDEMFEIVATFYDMEVRGQKSLFRGPKWFPKCLNGGFRGVFVLKSGLRILIRAPEVPFSVPPKR